MEKGLIPQVLKSEISGLKSQLVTMSVIWEVIYTLWTVV